MNILAVINYDPATAVTASTASALAMTALDTTNLRHTVTVPSHGFLRVRMHCMLHGAATMPSLLLGVLEGSTIRGRQAAEQRLANTANHFNHAIFDMVLSGLTPGSITLDAAYGVEVGVASTAIKYGGPNDTTASNAFGAFTFEIWDPQPSSGGGSADWTADERTAIRSILGVPGSGTTPTTPTVGMLKTIRDDVTTVDTVVDAVKAKTDNLPAAPAATSDIPSAATNASAVRTELTTELGRIDAAISSRMATFTYTAPANSDITAIKAKTDQFVFTVANQVDANALSGGGGGGGLTAADVRAAVGLASANLDTQLSILTHADGVETGVSFQQTQRALLAAMAGVATGGGGSSITLKNPAGSATRVVLAVDASGNRSASTITA